MNPRSIAKMAALAAVKGAVSPLIAAYKIELALWQIGRAHV